MKIPYNFLLLAIFGQLLLVKILCCDPVYSDIGEWYSFGETWQLETSGIYPKYCVMMSETMRPKSEHRTSSKRQDNVDGCWAFKIIAGSNQYC